VSSRLGKKADLVWLSVTEISGKKICMYTVYWVSINSVYAVYGCVYNASNAMKKYKNGLMV
jgi:hypothetical protein